MTPKARRTVPAVGDVVTLDDGSQVRVHSTSASAYADLDRGTELWGLDNDGEAVLARWDGKRWVYVDWTEDV